MLKSSAALKYCTAGLLTTPAAFIALRNSADLMNFRILSAFDQVQMTVRSFGELLARKTRKHFHWKLCETRERHARRASTWRNWRLCDE